MTGEEKKAYKREWYQRNKERLKQWEREHGAARRKKYYESHRTKIAEIHHEHYLLNRDRFLQYGRDRWDRNKDRLNKERKIKRDIDRPGWLQYQREHLLKKYNLTTKEYNIMLSKQEYKCPICKEPFNLVEGENKPPVDHNHKTGEVRGILCGRCNKALGGFKDSPAVLRSATNYLESKSPIQQACLKCEILWKDCPATSDCPHLISLMNHPETGCDPVDWEDNDPDGDPVGGGDPVNE